MSKDLRNRISKINNKHVSKILTLLLNDDILTPLSIETLVSYIEELETFKESASDNALESNF